MRKTYIDNIRWMTVVIVLIYHVIYMFNGQISAGVIGPFEAVQYQDGFQYVVYPWFMLLMFVISGMSARFYLNRHSEKEFIRSRTRKLLVPSTIGLFVFWWILGYYNMLIAGAFDSMLALSKVLLYVVMAISGTGALWYIQLLWVLSVFLVFIRRFEKDRLYVICGKTDIIVLLMMTIAIWGSAQILNTPVIVVYRFGIYGLGFLLGYFVFSHDAVMERLEKWWLILIIAAILLCIVFVLAFWGQPYADHQVIDTFLCNAYAWISTLAVLATMKKWGNFENSFTRFMNQKAWGLYLFHYLPMAMSAWYLHLYFDLSPLFMYLVVGISGFAGAIILYEVISRIPFLRWCICGIRGK